MLPSRAATAEQSRAPLFDLVTSLHRTIGLVSERVVEHGTLVASIAAAVGRELGASAPLLEQLLIGGALHDVGGIAGKLTLSELDTSGLGAAHAEAGYSLLCAIEPLRDAALLIRHHHDAWSPASEQPSLSDAAALVALADAVALRVSAGVDERTVDSDLYAPLRERAGQSYAPRHVEAFLDLSRSPSFWRGRVLEAEVAVHEDLQRTSSITVDQDLVLAVAASFARIIDLRSHYTAEHGAGVALVAAHLAGAARWSPELAQELRIAGYLHDIGKIAIPTGVLEKPSRLSDDEMRLMRSHPYLAHLALTGLPGFARIASWTAEHHERIDGKGYPFGLGESELTEGSRLLAVADVYAALSEDRPYRGKLARAEVLALMHTMVRDGALDCDAVTLLEREVDSVEHALQDARAVVIRG